MTHKYKRISSVDGAPDILDEHLHDGLSDDFSAPVPSFFYTVPPSAYEVHPTMNMDVRFELILHILRCFYRALKHHHTVYVNKTRTSTSLGPRQLRMQSRRTSQVPLRHVRDLRGRIYVPELDLAYLEPIIYHSLQLPIRQSIQRSTRNISFASSSIFRLQSIHPIVLQEIFPNSTLYLVVQNNRSMSSPNIFFASVKIILIPHNNTLTQ